MKCPLLDEISGKFLRLLLSTTVVDTYLPVLIKKVFLNTY